MKRILACLTSATILAGCSSSPQLPNYDSPTIPFFAALGAGAYILYKDNWTLQEIPAGNNKFQITLKKNMLRQNGDSEASMLFKRRASEIVAEQGFDGYRIMEYSEGIESASLGPQRVAHGVIQCYKEAAPAK